MLETDRLVIRPFRKNDYEDLYEYLSLEETYRFEPGDPISLQEAKSITDERSDSINWWAVTIKDDDTGKLIGHISLFQTEPDIFQTWELGYIFNPAYHNHGYATEAARSVIGYVFNEMHAHRIVAYCNPENIPSCRVLEKCGMTREGLRRKNAFFRTDDTGNLLWFDSCEYAILIEDKR